ncbi:helix-turn-helix domain-containing protein [Schlegelella sp. S2-27]|uniref:Helix-turn-helix domain-containing protein n=1 Tax=Caldimonas mangrovi TaxID=2944811 RepID=A0ABT0YMT0_9BURK|nr:helix-turn-helix domain-containing protein [Caldimonas mangrovi]MCM5680032.1 helix-turn-helix domain-containing protein [Caldimonas mangrovi]
MPNLAQLLKTEITRLARRQVRDETTALKKASVAHRSEIAELKRAVRALQQDVRRLMRQLTADAAPNSPQPAEPRIRFSGKGLLGQRRRLGLSAEDCGLLLGVSTQSVYNWETGKARPREKQMPAIASLRKLGKQEAAAQLASSR